VTSAVLRTRPVDTSALMAYGGQLHAETRLDEAAVIYRQILAHDPAHFDATHLLGVIALQQGRYSLAQQLIARALVISPRDHAAMANLGVSYLSEGRLSSACEWFRVALILQPDSTTALLNLGTALQRLGDHGEAAKILERASDADPDSDEIHSRLAQSLLAIGERQTAESPGAPHAETLGAPPQVLCQSAFVLLANGYCDEACDRLRRAIEAEPFNLVARWVLALAPLRMVYEDALQVTESREAFSSSLNEIDTWCARHLTEVKEPHLALGVLQPFTLAYHPFNNRDLLIRYGRLCARVMATMHAVTDDPAAAGTGGRTNSLPPDRIRLGIASPHIKEHSVWHAITKGWVHQLDRNKFDLFLFQLNPDADDETRRVRDLVTELEDGPRHLADWVRAIEARKLDVLLYPSIGMDPLTQQLAALRLAPVQAVAWGHPETTGFPTMDIYLSGELLEPERAELHYSERLIRLPNFGVYVEPLDPQHTALDLTSLDLPVDEPLLLCPGTPFKYSPLFDDVWVSIAKGLKKPLFGKRRGLLVFFRSHLANMDRVLEARLRTAFERADLNFDASVRFIPHLDRGRYFALMRQSACLVDTLEFSGFNTAIQALQCDLPVLAYEGQFMRGRLASALLRRLDLPTLIARTQREFVDKAVELARDATKRRSLRSAIGQRRELLFRDSTAVRALEDVLSHEVSRARACTGSG